MIRSLLFLATCHLLPIPWASARPNILFIMSDDHAAHAIGAYGGRLAKEGMLFENAFCTNSICSPSRACLLTGQNPHTNGAYDLNGSVSPENQHLAIEMKKAGYQTAMSGKWHLKKEPAAFDYYCVLPGQGEYHNPEFLVRGDQPWGRTSSSSRDCTPPMPSRTSLSSGWQEGATRRSPSS
jgi:N-acetylglucosamine-6-sulfatase